MSVVKINREDLGRLQNFVVAHRTGENIAEATYLLRVTGNILGNREVFDFILAPPPLNAKPSEPVDAQDGSLIAREGEDVIHPTPTLDTGAAIREADVSATDDGTDISDAERAAYEEYIGDA